MSFQAVTEADYEEMDIIYARLNSRRAESSLEGGVMSLEVIREALENRDLELMRAFDACYSERLKPGYIRQAFSVLRSNIPADEPAVLTTDGMMAYHQVFNAVMTHNTNRPFGSPSTISDEGRNALLVLSMQNPALSYGISTIITERGIYDAQQIVELLEFMNGTATSLQEGTL